MAKLALDGSPRRRKCRPYGIRAPCRRACFERTRSFLEEPDNEDANHARIGMVGSCVVPILLLSACATTAGIGGDAKERVAAATRAWIDAMGSDDQERVLALYDPEAVLWGTTSPAIRDTPASIREYFDFLRTAPSYYKGVLGEQRIRVYGDMAINTGTYTFIGPGS